MAIVDCVPVICGGCGAGIWTVKAYADEPLCYECRVRLEKPYEEEDPVTPSGEGVPERSEGGGGEDSEKEKENSDA